MIPFLAGVVVGVAVCWHRCHSADARAAHWHRMWQTAEADSIAARRDADSHRALTAVLEQAVMEER